MNLKVETTFASTLYNQLAMQIIEAIDTNKLRVGDRLPSVNQACKLYNISRDTVLSAYKLLQEKQIVVAIQGKGFFVNRKRDIDSRRVFVLFDAMNQYKETLYRTLTESLGEKYEISISFHYYNAELFDTMVSNAVGHYDYYILMPHFNCDVRKTLDKIPAERLLLLDAFPQGYSANCSAVYQDFQNDSYEGLKSIYNKLSRYEALHIIYNDRFQYMPEGYKIGAYRFAGEFGYKVTIEPGFDTRNIERGHCYMAISERDLASFIKQAKEYGLKIGEDVGLMSLDDTPLKEVLIGGVTTLTTDFGLMGEQAAKLIHNRQIERIANPWRLHDRGSL